MCMPCALHMSGSVVTVGLFFFACPCPTRNLSVSRSLSSPSFSFVSRFLFLLSLFLLPSFCFFLFFSFLLFLFSFLSFSRRSPGTPACSSKSAFLDGADALEKDPGPLDLLHIAVQDVTAAADASGRDSGALSTFRYRLPCTGIRYCTVGM